MNLLRAYNERRDREADAFEATPLGAECRQIHNSAFRGVIGGITVALVTSLAAEYAFGFREPAFYAGRSLRLW